MKNGPEGLGSWLHDVGRAITSILDGLAVTLSWMFRRPMTLQYPDKLAKPIQDMLPEAYRGILEVDVRLCTGCMLCEKTCPISVLTIDVQKNAEGVRELVQFDIDIARCMYCGLCSEACNTGAIAHTAEFEASAANIADLTIHFVTHPTPVAKAKASDEITRAPRGSIVKPLIPRFGRRTGMAPGSLAAKPEPVAPAPEPMASAPEPVAPAPEPAAPVDVTTVPAPEKEPTP